MQSVTLTLRPRHSVYLIFRDYSLHLQWRHSQFVSIPVKYYIFAQSLGAATLLDPLTPPGACPQTPQEPNRAVLSIREVMGAHNRLDGLGGFVGVVEWNG